MKLLENGWSGNLFFSVFLFLKTIQSEINSNVKTQFLREFFFAYKKRETSVIVGKLFHSFPRIYRKTLFSWVLLLQWRLKHNER